MEDKQLSFGGRTTLIQSVLSVIPFYYLSFYRVPNKILSELVSLQRYFLWGGDENKQKIAWVNWDTVCKDKALGGL